MGAPYVDLLQRRRRATTPSQRRGAWSAAMRPYSKVLQSMTFGKTQNTVLMSRPLSP